MRSATRSLLCAVVLAVLVAAAGCTDPGGDSTEPSIDETPTTADNDAGAEPIAPNGTGVQETATDASPDTATRTANPDDAEAASAE